MPKNKSFLPSAAREENCGRSTSRPAEPLIKIQAAAMQLGVSAVTVRRWVKGSVLPHIRISGRLYFKKSELHAFIEARRGDLIDDRV